MNDVSTQLQVQLKANQHRQGNKHIELHFGQPLMLEGDFRDITPGPHALDHILEFTPLMQHILRKLFARPDDQVNGVIVMRQHLIINHHAALTLEQISDIFEQAAEAVGMDYRPGFGSE